MKKDFDTYQISSENRPTLSASEIRACQEGCLPVLRTVKDLEDFQNPLSQLKALTNEQKAYINEKYDLSKIKTDSHEYGLLMGELCQMGILSNLPFSAPLNITSVSIDADGNIISYMAKVDDIDEDADLLDWFSQSLNLNGKRHKKLLEDGVSSLADKLFMKQFDSFETIKTILVDLQQD
ncbi:hypothetical protein [Anaerotignum sp.]|uniref:hypothetical protein n=1 Tax=Anaerotignum sp. TaxID=2039241 RepID=UPI002714D77A|nr:hypothetical protein [Anaerotignum sp.]